MKLFSLVVLAGSMVLLSCGKVPTTTEEEGAEVEAYYGNTRISAAQLRGYLRKAGFNNTAHIEKMVCIAQNESKLYVGAVSDTNSDGSKDYGIFQLNNMWWPSNRINSGARGRGPCASTGVLTSSVLASAQCAKIVVQQQGFCAWTTARNICGC
jgi:lysozyme C